MSTTQEVLNEVSTFHEDTTKTNGTLGRRGLVEGQYLGHIVNAKSIIRPVRDRYKARIYNYDVIVADEHAKRTHQYEDITGKVIEISGEQFVGKKLMAKGIFKFLDPQEGDDFEGNPTDNKKYSLFCDTLGLTPKEETRTIDGKETIVRLLPLLTVEHMVGRPVIAHLVKTDDSWTNKEGETIPFSWRVSYCQLWADGTVKKMTVDENDLPF